jgi:hypothetical protein
MESDGPAAGPGTDVRLEWDYRVMGGGIGAAGLHVVDLAGDRGHRVVATAGVDAGSYWYVLVAGAGGYEMEWASDVYADPIGRLQVAQLDGDRALEIVVGVGSRILVYDGATHALQSSFPTAASAIGQLVVADPDADGSKEFVFCASHRGAPGPLFVLDAGTGVQEYRGDAYPCTAVAVGNLHGGSAREIVLGKDEGGPSWVLDGRTHAVEWTHYFGDFVRLGDLDGDGRDEIVTALGWPTGIWIFEGDSQRLIATITPDGGVSALRLVDVDGDGRLEIVYSVSGSGERVYVRDGATRALKWSVPNPEGGATDIAVGNADADRRVEMVMGGYGAASRPGRLHVVDTVSRAQEWQSQVVTGPFLALSSGDLDADGYPEIVYASSSSEGVEGRGLYFVRDAATHAIEYASGPLAGRGTRIRNANVDGDAQQEILVLTDATLSCVDGLTHLEQWHWGTGGRSLELADVDRDGRLEAIVSVWGSVVLLDAETGALEWQSPSLGSVGWDLSFLRVANVDSDFQPEIVVASTSGGVFLVERVARTVQTLSAGFVTALDTPDRDGDGVHEIVVGTREGQLLLLDAAGGAPVTLGWYGGRIDGLAIADVDEDGRKETVFGVDDELFVYAGSSGMLWRSGRLLPPENWGHPAVAEWDSLRVGDLDRDGFVEVMVGMGYAGVRVYEIRSLPTPRLAVVDVVVPEGSGPAEAAFAVTLSPASTSTVTVDYATAGGTATPGVDYVSVSGTLTFPAGATSRRLEVPILGDAVYEASETFLVRLTGAVSAVIDDGEAVGTIADDDSPGFSIDDVTVQQPESGTAIAMFTVTLAPASYVEASIDFTTEDGTATAPGDYAAVSGHLMFPPGTQVQTIEVPVEAAAGVEATEMFGVRLTGAMGASVARDLGTGTIRGLVGGFYAVSPCRAVDTRQGDGPALAAKEERSFALGGRCGVPITARAVAVNVTVTDATAGGNLRVFADGIPLPGTSVLNYTAGVTRANNAVVQLSPWGAVEAYASQPTGSAHLILDVTGYFE